MTKSNTRRGFTQQGNVVIKNKVILNLIQDLQRLALLFLNNMRGRSRIKYGMTPNWITTHGFTLIELLVGVLIIGILAAVALPQYNKTVKRVRIMDAVQFVKTVEKATDLWLLQNGGFPEEETVLLGKDINLLDIDVSGILEFNSPYMASSVSGNFIVLTLPFCDSSSCGFIVEGDGNLSFSVSIGRTPTTGWSISCDPSDPECQQFKALYDGK